MYERFKVVALFSQSSYAVVDWAKAGCICYCLDINNIANDQIFPSGGKIIHVPWDATKSTDRDFVTTLQPNLILAFPPCTNLAVSGAKHFATKTAANPDYLQNALDMVFVARDLGIALAVPYLIENPVGVISANWRKPDFIFDPRDFGGYLPENDTHPEFPQYIAARDAYVKKTCIWQQGLKLPTCLPVYVQPGWSLQQKKLGGKSDRTKYIRSLTPRGFFRALFLANFLK